MGVKNGDYLAYNQLFIRYYGRLCGFVIEFTKSETSAEDVVQELFIKLWTDRKRIIVREKVAAYLFRASRNAALNYLRSEKNRQKAMDGLGFEETYPDDNPIEFEEFLDQLKACVDELPERSKEVFVLSRLEGFKHKEIAEKLDISVKTIKNQIWKSLQYLRTCLLDKKAL